MKFNKGPKPYGGIKWKHAYTRVVSIVLILFILCFGIFAGFPKQVEAADSSIIIDCASYMHGGVASVVFSAPDGNFITNVDFTFGWYGDSMNVYVEGVLIGLSTMHPPMQYPIGSRNGYGFIMPARCNKVTINTEQGMPCSATIRLSPYLAQEATVESAVTAAQAAKTSADAANSNAYWALQNASAANSQTTYGGSSAAYLAYLGQLYSSNAATAANNAKTSSDTANNNITTANNTLNAINTKLTNSGADTTSIKTDTTNILNALGNTAPVISIVQGINGATCTTTGIFKLGIFATGATQYRAWIDAGTDSGWVALNTITLNGISKGAQTINIQVKNASEAVANSRINIFSI